MYREKYACTYVFVLVRRFIMEETYRENLCPVPTSVRRVPRIFRVFPYSIFFKLLLGSSIEESPNVSVRNTCFLDVRDIKHTYIIYWQATSSIRCTFTALTVH